MISNDSRSRSIQDYPQVTTMVELLETRAKFNPDRVVHTFLENGYTASRTLTFKGLSVKAKQIAAYLLKNVNPGDHVLMCTLPVWRLWKPFLDAFMRV